MAFETYKKGMMMFWGRHKINGNIVSLYKNGSMAINYDAIIDLELAKYKSVWFHFDRESMEMMLEFNPELVSGANIATVSGSKLILSGKGPMKFFGIPLPEKTIHMPIRKTDKLNVFIVKLPDGDAP